MFLLNIARLPEYAHTDHLGTVQVATTDAGLMRPHTYYMPYGEAMDGPAQASTRPELDLTPSSVRSRPRWGR